MDIQNDETGINLSFCDTPDYSFSKMHFHNAHKIIFVTEGTVKIDISEKCYSVSANSLVFISNLEKHSVAILRSPYKRYVISLPQDFGFILPNHSPLLSILMQRPANFSHAIELSAEAANEIRKVINAMLTEQKEKRAFWSERFMISVTELLIILYRYSSSIFPVNEVNNAVRIVSEVQQYIVHHSEEEISLDSMANRHFVNKYYLSHIFKTITGYTFKSFLILHRVSAAKTLLLHTDYSVTEICLSVGFNNVNHFIRIFKSIEGITPYQYKKQHLNH